MQNSFKSDKRIQSFNKQTTLIKQKKQSFKFEIRNIQIKNAKIKMRKLMNFKSQQNYNQLKNINLIQDLQLLLQVQTQINSSNLEKTLQHSTTSFIFSPQLEKVINNIFIYAVSSETDHLCSLMFQCHLEKLLFFMIQAYLKKQQQRYFAIFNKTLWILSNFTSYDPRQMPNNFIKYLYHFLSEQRHSKQIIQLCLNSLINMLKIQQVKSYIIETHLKDRQKDSTIDRILKIMSMIIDQIQNKKQENQYSTTPIVLHLLLQKILQFYAKLFQFVEIELLSEQYKQYFFQKVQFILLHFSNQLHTMEKVIKTLTQLYVKNIKALNLLIIQTQNIIKQLTKFLQSSCKLFKKNFKQNNLLQSVINQTIFCIFYIYTPFEPQKQQESMRQDALQILDNNLSQNLLTALYYGLLCPKQIVNNWCLKTLIQICEEYQFTDLIIDDLRILNQIFHHSYHSSFNLKKSATICLCRLVQTLFINQSANNQDKFDEQYQMLTNNKLIQIMVTNLDQYVDVNLNMQILEAIDVLCQYWSQGLQNKFWNKFQEQGGKFKLETILNNQRQKKMQQKADIILRTFAKTQLQF